MKENDATQKALIEVAVGDIARLRKVHPCGGRDWLVTRIGADIGLECRTCARKVLLPREEFERRCVGLIVPPPQPSPVPGEGEKR